MYYVRPKKDAEHISRQKVIFEYQSSFCRYDRCAPDYYTGTNLLGTMESSRISILSLRIMRGLQEQRANQTQLKHKKHANNATRSEKRHY